MPRLGLVPRTLLLFCMFLGCTVRSTALASPPQDKALIAAIDKQDLVRVNALLAAGANPNAQDTDDGKYTALDHAVETGSVAICEALLKKGARVEDDLDTLVTPLFRAVSANQAPVVKLLLKYGAHADTVAGIHGSALGVAGATGQIDIMQMLLERGASPQLDRKHNSFPLGEAALEGQKAAVEWLLAHGARIDDMLEDGHSALMSAASQGHLDIVNLLLAHTAQVNLEDASGDTALDMAKGPQRAAILAVLKQAGAKEADPTLFRAIKKNDTRLLRELLGKGADPNETDAAGKTPLFYSLRQLDHVALKTLLENGADPNARDKQGETPLSVAKKDRSSASKELIASGAYAPELDLNNAILENDIKSVMAWLDAKVDPNGTDLQGRSPLENALRTGHSDLVRLLVRRGANVNAAGNTELPPLMTAVSKGSIADVRFLLEKGADATFVSPNGENLLMSVQTPGSLEMVRLLVEHGAPVQGRIKDYNRSVLEILAETADAPMIQYLLEHGAGPDLTTKDSDGETPLAMAARGGNLAVVQLLLAKGGDPNTVDSEGDTPIHHAVHSLLRGVQEESSRERRRAEKPGLKANGEAVEAVQPEKPHNGVAERAAVILLLAKQGAKLEVRNKAGSTPMELALQADSLEALRALQQAGARWPTSQGPKSLLAAAQEDDLDGVRKLLAKGVNPNAADKFGYTPLMLAALRGELEIVRALLLHGAKPDYRVKDENGILLSTPLMLAAEGGHNDIVRLLLKHGANPKIPLADYDWPLYEIVGKGHLQTLRIMLEAGMDVNAGEKAGRTPLMRSVGLIGGAETVHLLLAKGAHVNGKFDRGITPLMKAAEAGRTESIHMLMGAEADIKARSEEGETVLMYAVKSGDIEVVRIVLNTSITAHADINARDKHQKSALSLALDYRFEGIAQALQQAGAKE